MRPRLKIQTYQRANGNNEFKAYLDKLDDKERKKFITVLHKIEYKGRLVARKNKWFSNLRDTGLIEFRSKVGHSQQRGLGYYDNLHRMYVLLTGYTKKEPKINKTIIEYAQQLKDLALKEPNFVDYEIKPTIRPAIEHPIKARKVHYVKTKHPTVIPPVKSITTASLASESSMASISNKPVSSNVKSMAESMASTKAIESNKITNNQTGKKAPIKMTKNNPKNTTTSNSGNNQRLQRLFDDIANLTPNQILIISDLINSWK